MRTVIYTFGVGAGERGNIQFALQKKMLGGEEIIISPLLKATSYGLDGKKSETIDVRFIIIFSEEDNEVARDILKTVRKAVPDIKVI